MGGKATTGARSGKFCTLYKVVKELFPNKGKKAIDGMVDAIKEKVSGLSIADSRKALKEILLDIPDQDISFIVDEIFKNKELSDAELRAKEIIELRGKEASKYETFCVSKVKSKKTGKTRTIITSSTDHKTAPDNIKLKENEEFINKGPHLVRRPVRGEDGKILKDEKGKIITQTFEKVEVDGKIIEVPYDKSKESRHHAEQKFLKALNEDDEIVEIVPTRPCCKGCQKALGENLEKVPPHLRGKK